jgi:Kdo2-lipid IVA lauroyltransferase/acyltransferase
VSPLLRRLRAAASGLAEAAMVGLVRALFAALRALGAARSSALGGRIARTLGPLFPAHRTAQANVRAAFPGIDAASAGRIVAGAWDNLGRTAGEYPHLGALFDYDPEAPAPGRVEVVGIEHFLRLRDDGLPALIFSAHLGNWELPAICAARFGLDATAVFRAPNDRAIAQVIHEVRRETMGGLEAARAGAAFAMQGVLERGGHLGMLVDQHFTRGVVVEFLGRPALVNPVMGKFARRFDCPVHGVRVIRLPDHRFRLELTPPLDLPRDAAGEIDVQGAMQAMTTIVEGWVREHPEQWLWMHRRWRPAMLPARSRGAQTGDTQPNVTSVAAAEARKSGP